MRISGKRVFISGGAGFIGASLAERLLEENRVVIYDNFHRDCLSGRGLAKHPNLEVIRGDILDFERLQEAVSGADLIVHLASIAGVDTVRNLPIETMKVGFVGTLNMLEAALKLDKLDRFVGLSTSEVFGSYAYKVGEGEPTTLGAVGEARWTYAVTKLAAEHLSLNYHKRYGLPTVSIRPFNVYGPHQAGEGAIHHFVERAVTGRDLVVHNDGSQIRAWCYIDDMLDGIELCLFHREAIAHAFNIGDPRSTITIYNLARLIRDLSKSNSRVVFAELDEEDVELRVPEIGKATALLGFKPKVDLQDGLLATIEYYRKVCA